MLSYLVLLNNLENQFEFTRSKITLKRGLSWRAFLKTPKNVSDPKSFLNYSMLANKNLIFNNFE